MLSQNSPTTKAPITIDLIHECVSIYPDDTLVFAVAIPIGVQVQIFYTDFAIEKALYGIGQTTIDVTHIVNEMSIPVFDVTEYLKGICNTGTLDLSGTLYFSPEAFKKINISRAVDGKTTFRYMESAVSHTLNCGEYIEDLQFSPNWSDVLTSMSSFEAYGKVLNFLKNDFKVLPSTRAYVKNIEQIVSFYHTLLKEQTLYKQDYLIKSIVLFKDDLSKLPKMTCAENNILAEILLHENPSVIRIDSIEAEPDRFGRVRPVISSDSVLKSEEEYFTIELPTIEALSEVGYETGDTVEIKFINVIPKLGKIVAKNEFKNIQPPLLDNCCYCNSKFIKKHSQLYCPNPQCPSTTFYKTLYARSKRALDLPLNYHSIYYFVMVDNSIWDLPSLFDLDRTKLLALFDTDLTEFILETLRTRTDQINGVGFSREVQNNAQGKFLDALSITGLHSRNIKSLKKSLWAGFWSWTELPLVLTDKSILVDCGISQQDAVEIANSAKPRITELDTLIREVF